jgi:hypothetical protein
VNPNHTHPTLTPGTRVHLHDHRLGRNINLIISHTEPPDPYGRAPTIIIATDPRGHGRWRRPAHDYTRGWA